MESESVRLIAPLGADCKGGNQKVTMIRMGNSLKMLKDHCPLFQALLAKATETGRVTNATMIEEVKGFLSNERKAATADPALAEFEALVAAAACIMLFTQQNVTGPVIKTEDLVPDSVEKEAMEELILSGEDLSAPPKSSFLLVVAKAILLDNDSSFTELRFFQQHWKGRSLTLHRKLFPTNVAELRGPALECWSGLCTAITGGGEETEEKREEGGEEKESLEIPESVNNHPVIKATILMEAAQCFSSYHHSKRAARALDAAEKCTKVKIDMTGKLGKRTKYQETSKTQLVVSIRSDNAVLDQDDATKRYWKALVEKLLPPPPSPHSNEGPPGKPGKGDGKDNNSLARSIVEFDPPSQSERAPFRIVETSHVATAPNGGGEAPKHPGAGASRVDRALVLLRARLRMKTTMSEDTIGRHISLAQLYSVYNSSPSEQERARGGESWGVFSTLLYLRALWEAPDREMAQRSLIQLENLHHHVSLPLAASTAPPVSAAGKEGGGGKARQDGDAKKPQGEAEGGGAALSALVASFRASECFTAGAPMAYQVALSLADGYKKMNMTQSALSEYTRLQCWPEMIRCSIILGRKANAEEMVVKQLEKVGCER
eukprot:jgi/Bigna1/82412/fgenesh1_pg.92_\